jgi:Flp pilus assembly secretin CpaC
MRRKTLLILLAWLGMLSTAPAQSHPYPRNNLSPPLPPLPYPLPHEPLLPPQPVTLPADGLSPSDCPYACDAHQRAANGDGTDRIRHLRQAADHLEAAGLTDQATVLRQQAADLAALLAEKRKQLEAIQAEIDQLSKTTAGSAKLCLRADSTAQVQLNVQILQLSRQKLTADDPAALIQKLIGPTGEHSDSMRNGSPASTGFTMAVHSQQSLDNALAALRKAGAVKVLAEPVLLTTSGPAASVRMGEEHPLLVPGRDGKATIEFKLFGIHLDALPVLCDSSFIRLELRPRISTRDLSRTVKIGGHSIPGMRIREMDTAVELRLGQTFVLGCIGQPGMSKNVRKVSTAGKDGSPPDDIVFVVTPALLEAGSAPRMPPAATAPEPEPDDSWWHRFRREQQ